jgi:hypothetical protein
MIAKGNLHGDGAKLAAYLVTGKEGELAELIEMRGFPTDNIRDAFLAAQIGAEALTKSTRPFFHTYVRLLDGESLNREQWQHVADRIEKQLGFDDQPRALAFHHLPDGATHLHIAWSRVDIEHECAIDPGLYKLKLKEISRELERDLGLTRVKNERDPEQKTLAPGRNEFEQARRLGTDLKAIREDIRDCWERSDNGKSFEAALAERGYVLARGDKRDFVVVDHAGGDHALGKRITGATAAETRARLADIDRAQLPSVEAAKELLAERAHDAPALQKATPGPEILPAGISFSAASEPAQEPEWSAASSEPETADPIIAAEPHDHGIRSANDVAGGLAGGLAGAVFHALADFFEGLFSSKPALTPAQENQMRVAQENEFQRFVKEQGKALFAVNEQNKEQEQQRRREQEEIDARRQRDDRQR